MSQQTRIKVCFPDSIFTSVQIRKLVLARKLDSCLSIYRVQRTSTVGDSFRIKSESISRNFAWLSNIPLNNSTIIQNKGLPTPTQPLIQYMYTLFKAVVCVIHAQNNYTKIDVLHLHGKATKYDQK